VQAGSSDTRRRFAAPQADAVFTAAHMEKATVQEFCVDLKALAVAEGGRPIRC
jgi:alkanesulfonate monooxygenase SsuD/methylene tetrahydromethanopterin reductase-like flavin-dependent oxidoreductase (luciferase family)